MARVNLETFVRLLAVLCLAASAPLLFFAVLWIFVNCLVAADAFKWLFASGGAHGAGATRQLLLALISIVHVVAAFAVVSKVPVVFTRPASRSAIAVWAAAVLVAVAYFCLMMWAGKPELLNASAPSITVFAVLPAAVGVIAAAGAALSAILFRRVKAAVA